MTYDDVQTLIDYNYWARNQLMDAVATLSAEEFTRDMGSSFRSVRDTIAHMCDAERIWLSRLRGEEGATFGKAERMPEAAAAQREWRELEAGMREAVALLGPEGVERTLAYKDTRGRAHEGVPWQIVQHMVNHESYHRGQVTTMLRQLGAQPPKSMDLIAYYRVTQTNLQK